MNSNSTFTFAIRPPGESFWVRAMGGGAGSDPHRLQSACRIERVSCSVLIIAALLVVWFPPGACAFAPVPLQHFGPPQLSKRATCSSEWAGRPIPSAPCAKRGGTWRLPELSCQNSDEPFGGGGGESGENQNESLSCNQDRRGAQGASARDRDGRQGSGGGLDSDQSSAGNRRQGSGGQGSAGAGGIVSTRTSTRGYSFSVNRAAPARAASMHTVHPPPLSLPTILAQPSALSPCRRSSRPWAPTRRTAAMALLAGVVLRKTTPKAPVRAGTLPALSRAGGCSAPRSTARMRLTAARRRSGRRGRAPLCEPRQARRGGARRRTGATGQGHVGRRCGRPVIGRERGGETRDPPHPLPRTNRTSLVPPLVLSGYAASLTPYMVRRVTSFPCCLLSRARHAGAAPVGQRRRVLRRCVGGQAMSLMGAWAEAGALSGARPSRARAAPYPQRAAGARDWRLARGVKRRGVAGRGPLPPPSRTNWTRLVPPCVLTGHVSPRYPFRRRRDRGGA